MTDKKLVVDLSKGTHEYVDLTSAEIAQRAKDAADYAAQEAAAESDRQIAEGLKASAKAKLIAGEPLTEAEAATIVL